MNRKRNDTLSQQEIARARAALESGVRLVDVAKRFNVATETLWAHGLRTNRALANKPGQRKKNKPKRAPRGSGWRGWSMNQ